MVRRKRVKRGGRPAKVKGTANYLKHNAGLVKMTLAEFKKYVSQDLNAFRIHRFKSGFEVHKARELAEECVDWDYESVKFHFTVPETKHTYTNDFPVKTRTGMMYIETKGKFKAPERKKLIQIRDQHNIDLRLLFMNANVPINPNSKTTLGEWATKNNFKWAHKTIPKEWLKEMVNK